VLIRVAGGTNAGWKPAPLSARTSPWTCPTCGARMKPYWRNCPNDMTPRPEEDE